MLACEGTEAMVRAPPLPYVTPHVTQQYCLASKAARLSSTGISYHSLLPHIPSICLSAVKLCCCSFLLFSHYVRLSVTPRATACQASLCFTISRSLLRLMSIELVMPFNYLILCKVSDTTEHWSTVHFEYHWRINHSLAIHFFFFTLETKIALLVFACESKTH